MQIDILRNIYFWSNSITKWCGCYFWYRTIRMHFIFLFFFQSIELHIFPPNISLTIFLKALLLYSWLCSFWLKISNKNPPRLHHLKVFYRFFKERMHMTGLKSWDGFSWPKRSRKHRYIPVKNKKNFNETVVVFPLLFFKGLASE